LVKQGSLSSIRSPRSVRFDQTVRVLVMPRPPSTTSEAAVDVGRGATSGAFGTADDHSDEHGNGVGADHGDGGAGSDDEEEGGSGWARGRVRGSIAMAHRANGGGGGSGGWGGVTGENSDDEDDEVGDAAGEAMGDEMADRRAAAAARGSIDSVSTAQLDAEWERWQTLGRLVHQGTSTGGGGGGGGGGGRGSGSDGAAAAKSAAVWASVWK
jgi:hypothetical protein